MIWFIPFTGDLVSSDADLLIILMLFMFIVCVLVMMALLVWHKGACTDLNNKVKDENPSPSRI